MNDGSQVVCWVKHLLNVNHDFQRVIVLFVVYAKFYLVSLWVKARVDLPTVEVVGDLSVLEVSFVIRATEVESKVKTYRVEHQVG